MHKVKLVKRIITKNPIDSSSCYPDRDSIIPHQPQDSNFQKIIEAKKCIKPSYKGRNISHYYYKPSENYSNFINYREKVLFNLNKRAILGDINFLDKFLNKLFHLQTN